MLTICRRLMIGLSAQTSNFHTAIRCGYKTEHIKSIISVTDARLYSVSRISTKPKMSNIKDLASVSESEQREFIDSVDHVICDLDGVVWIFGAPIEGVPACLQRLRELGKNVIFVSNNAILSVDWITKKLEDAGYGKNPHVTTPILSVTHYLKSINFNKVVYVVGSQPMKDALRQAGFKVAEDVVGEVDPSLYNLMPHFKDDENVGAVVIDWETNINFIKCQKAIIYLKRPDVIFLTGATDSKFPFLNGLQLIGPKYYQKSIEDLSGRTPIGLGKPSTNLNEYIKTTYHIADPSRALFVGDTIAEDMTFAANSGYKKLLVLSGVTKMDDILNWQYPEKCKPNYYIQSLGHLHKIVADMRK